MQETQVGFLRREWLPTPVFLPGEIRGSGEKNLLTSAGDTGDVGSIPGSGRSPTHSSILAWKIPWSEELSTVGCSPWDHKKSDTTEQAPITSGKKVQLKDTC